MRLVQWTSDSWPHPWDIAQPSPSCLMVIYTKRLINAYTQQCIMLLSRQWTSAEKGKVIPAQVYPLSTRLAPRHKNSTFFSGAKHPCRRIGFDYSHIMSSAGQPPPPPPRTCLARYGRSKSSQRHFRSFPARWRIGL